MTAPLRSGEPIVVQVALGTRAYDIAIGRGLIASLGERIKALRPSAKCAIVTDAAVAKHHLPAAERALKSAGIESSAIVVPEGEGSKNYATFETVCEAIVAEETLGKGLERAFRFYAFLTEDLTFDLEQDGPARR